MPTLDRGQPGRRYVVVGTTGSGKTTMAAAIAVRLGLSHVEMDALHWEPNWQEAPLEVFRQRVDQATRGEAWAADGNYSKVRDIVWGRADTVVWLDFSLLVIMGRLLWRTLRRVVTREELWNRNRESWREQFFSRDSLLRWVLTTYRRRRRQIPEALSLPEYAHLAVVHLRSPRAARRWLATIGPHLALRPES